jgi:hypothetical protein
MRNNLFARTTSVLDLQFLRQNVNCINILTARSHTDDDVCVTLMNRLLVPEHCTTCVTLVTIVLFFHVLVTAHQTARRHNPEDVSTSSELYYLWTSKNNQTEQI